MKAQCDPVKQPDARAAKRDVSVESFVSFVCLMGAAVWATANFGSTLSCLLSSEAETLP